MIPMQAVSSPSGSADYQKHEAELSISHHLEISHWVEQAAEIGITSAERIDEMDISGEAGWLMKSSDSLEAMERAGDMAIGKAVDQLHQVQLEFNQTHSSTLFPGEERVAAFSQSDLFVTALNYAQGEVDIAYIEREIKELMQSGDLIELPSGHLEASQAYLQTIQGLEIPAEVVQSINAPEVLNLGADIQSLADDKNLAASAFSTLEREHLSGEPSPTFGELVDQVRGGDARFEIDRVGNAYISNSEGTYAIPDELKSTVLEPENNDTSAKELANHDLSIAQPENEGQILERDADLADRTFETQEQHFLSGEPSPDHSDLIEQVREGEATVEVDSSGGTYITNEEGTYAVPDEFKEQAREAAHEFANVEVSAEPGIDSDHIHNRSVEFEEGDVLESQPEQSAEAAVETAEVEPSSELSDGAGVEASSEAEQDVEQEHDTSPESETTVEHEEEISDEVDISDEEIEHADGDSLEHENDHELEEEVVAHEHSPVVERGHDVEL